MYYLMPAKNAFSGVCNIFLISFFCLLITSCRPSLSSTIETYSANIKNVPYDVIIVPGYPYTGAAWDRVVKLRMLWANYLFKKGYTKNIIFSGSAVYSPFVESKIMALYAVEMGVPQKNIYSEEKAEHSTENVYYSYRLAKQLGFKKIALASDPYQIENLRLFIKKFEIPVTFLPAQFDALRTLNMEEPCIDPSSAYNPNFISIIQRQSIFTRIRGTFGKHIIWNEEDLKKKRFRRRFKKRMIPMSS